MQITSEELGKHYASLSDGELEDIDPADLTDVARRVYESEVKKRHLHVTARPQREEPEEKEDLDPDQEGVAEDLEEEAEPDWLEGAVCICSFRDVARSGLARDALLASAVPCHLSEVEPDPESQDLPLHSEYQVMVPPALHLKAKTVLDKQIFNVEAEDGIRAHLAELSDDDLRALSLDDICGGMRDMLERLQRAYEEEVARRSA